MGSRVGPGLPQILTSYRDGTSTPPVSDAVTRMETRVLTSNIRTLLSSYEMSTSTNVFVTGNTVSSNNPYGIYLYQTAESVVNANDVYSNNVGIFLFSANNTI